MDLQTILQTQNLPPDQLVLVKNQIAGLAVTIRAPPAQTSTPIPHPQPVAVAPPPPPTPAAPKVSIDSLFGSGALASLMARTSATPQVSTPQSSPATAAIRSPTPQRAEPMKSSTPVPTDPMALLNALRKTGILPPTQRTNGSTPVPSTLPSLPFPFPLPIPPNFVPGTVNAQPPTLENITSDIAFKASSLKQYVPHVTISLPVFIPTNDLQISSLPIAISFRLSRHSVQPVRTKIHDGCGGEEEKDGAYGLAFQGQPTYHRGREEGTTPQLARG